MAVDTPDIYIELLSASGFEPNDYTTPRIPRITEHTLNTTDYDGTVTYSFEIVAFGFALNAITIQLRDTDDVVYATITLPAVADRSYNINNYDFTRQRVSFTPKTGSATYRIYAAVANQTTFNSLIDEESYYLAELILSAARIVIRQTQATKSKIQIPLFSRWVQTLESFSSDSPSPSYDEPMTTVAIPSYTTTWGAQEASLPTIRRGQTNTTVWQYNSSDIATVSSCNFRAYVGRNIIGGITRTQTIFNAFPGDSDWNFAVYRGTYGNGSSIDNTPTTMGEAQYHDNTNNFDLYLLPSSEMDYVYADEGYPWTATFTPDTSGIQDGDGLYLGGLIDGGNWLHFDDAFQLNFPANVSGVAAATLVYRVYYNSVADRQECKWTMYISWDYDTSSTAEVALFDKTANAIVAGTELSFPQTSLGEWKEASFSPALLTDGNEYEFRIKSDYSTGPAPYLGGVELELGLSPITMMTVWQRVTNSILARFDNWVVNTAWGTDVNGDGLAAVDIASRVLLYLPTSSSAVYFEATAIRHDAGNPGDSSYLKLLDLGATNNGATGNSAVTNSTIEWTTEAVFSRIRSAAITSNVTSGNSYGAFHSYGDTVNFFNSNGFILVTSDGEARETAYQQVTEWLATSTGTGGTGAGTNATLVYAEDLSNDDFGNSVGGWYFDTYNPNILIHYGEEGDNQHKLLTGGADGTVYQMTGAQDGSLGISCNVQTKAEDLGASRLRKLWGDVSLDTNTSEQSLSATLNYDNLTSSSAATTISNAARDVELVGPDSNDWVSARNLSLDITWLSTSQDTKLYSWSPRFHEDNAPLQAFSWETSETTFSLPGFIYTGYLYLPHISTADLSLTFTVDGTAQTPISITNSSGSISKDFIRLPVMKGKAWKLSITSSQQFRVGGKQVELLVKPWGMGGGWKKVTLFADTAPSEVAQ